MSAYHRSDKAHTPSHSQSCKFCLLLSLHEVLIKGGAGKFAPSLGNKQKVGNVSQSGIEGLFTKELWQTALLEQITESNAQIREVDTNILWSTRNKVKSNIGTAVAALYFPQIGKNIHCISLRQWPQHPHTASVMKVHFL